MFEKLKQSSVPLIIFGASIAGEAVLHTLKEQDIAVAAVCDNNRSKCGKKLLGVDIVHVSELKERFVQAKFIICVIDIADVVEQLRKLEYFDYLPAGDLLRHIDVFKWEYSKPAGFVDYVIGTCVLAHDSFIDPQKIFIRSVDVVLTERCSLRCRDCSNLMQYYQKPRTYSAEDIICSIENLCKNVDEINEFRLIGGEPFLNPRWTDVMRYALKEPKLHRVVIYTNGTIMPSPEGFEVLKHPKTLLIITDYGELSRQIDRLCDKLAELNIPFTRLPAGGWTDCSKIYLRDRNDDEVENIFALCCVKNAFTMMCGQLYRCPFSANADRLRAIPDFAEDRIDINDPDLTRKMLAAYVRRNNAIGACRYCEGRPLGGTEIPPAIQAEAPLEYTVMH